VARFPASPSQIGLNLFVEGAMSFNVPNTFVTQFQNNMELSLQQQTPAIWPLLRKTPVGGEKTEITDFLGASATQTGDDRHGDTKYNNTPHDRLWLAKPPEEYWAELVDRQDQLAAKIELGSGYMMAATAAINRAKDDAALAGIYGSIISGKTGTVTTPLGTGMAVPVTTGAASGNARMNVAKLRLATKLLAQNYVDTNEKKYMVLTAEQNDDLLSEVPVTSSDFKATYGGTVNDNGQVVGLLGWNFIHLELANPLLKVSSALSLDTNSFRKNPFWVESGVVGGAWEEIFTSIDPLPQKRLSRQVFAACIVAATRTQAGKVGYILNSEA
jgi:hypothetical protein